MFMNLGKFVSLCSILFVCHTTLAKEFSLLTYNIAGLPDYISSSNPSRNNPIIGKRINPYDIVLIQEDFRYHGKLLRDNHHPYRSRFKGGGFSGYGDGLNQLSNTPMISYQRIGWDDCSGVFSRLNDCLTPKGFTFSTQIINNIEVHIYNVHFDAGRHDKDKTARALNADQLIDFIKINSKLNAVIIAGDFNLKQNDQDDVNVTEKLLLELDLKLACFEVNCTDEKIDKIMFRSGTNSDLNLINRKILTNEFSDRKGPLSDHDPILGIFNILSK